MAASAAFPPPHSCDFCQKLVLYDRDGRWWKKALLEPSPDVEGMLSMRARKWILEKMESASEDLRHETALSLSHITVFDCTLGEARLAAEMGCNFCLTIINRVELKRISRGNKSGEVFLAGSLKSVIFGVLRYTKKSIPGVLSGSKKKVRAEFSIESCGKFEILALLGKLTFYSNQ
jgi:hypothetical protein